MKFDMSKCKAIHLVQSEFLHQFRLGTNFLINSSAEKDFHFMVGSTLNLSQKANHKEEAKFNDFLG